MRTATDARSDVTDLPIQAAPAQPAPHQAIYRRWRAQTFTQILGQDAVVETLRNAVRADRVAHAILFVGPRGTGKTSLARILAKAINCTNLQDGDPCDACPSCVSIREGRAMDLLEIDAASNRGIDAIRDLRERINYAPTDLKRKVYILDEAHQITRDAWNALLKSLEEPPPFVVFMFASTHPQEFPPAILSRLQRFDVRRLTTDEIEGKLRRILEADGRTATPEAIHLIARLAAGGMRDAESMLDQLLSSSTEGLDEAHVRDLLGLADEETVAGFVDALVAMDARTGMRLLDGLEERGRDLRGFLDQVIETLRAGIIGTIPMAHAVADLAAAARRLAAIDPSRAGVGGRRLQLELALFPDPALAPRAAPIAAAAAPAPVPAPTAALKPAPAPEPKPAATPTATPATGPAAPDGAPVRLRAASAAPAPSAASVQPTAPVPAATAATAAKRAATQQTGAATPNEAPALLAAEPAAGDLAVLRERWPEIVARISAHPPTKPLIVVCRPISVEDGIVTLGFPEDKAFLRQVAERRKAVLEDNISAVLGRPVGVRCVATNIDVLPDLPSDEEAAWILAQAQRIFGDDAADAAEVG
jgi:DNA polymerase-3 subunit gamma/tau